MPTRSVEEHVASLTVKMLRARLKKEGRSTNGLKAQLADRLLATLRAKRLTQNGAGEAGAHGKFHGMIWPQTPTGSLVW